MKRWFQVQSAELFIGSGWVLRTVHSGNWGGHKRIISLCKILLICHCILQSDWLKIYECFVEKMKTVEKFVLKSHCAVRTVGTPVHNVIRDHGMCKKLPQQARVLIISYTRGVSS